MNRAHKPKANFQFKLVKYHGISANFCIDMMLNKIKSLTERRCELTVRSIFIEPSMFGPNFKDVSVDYKLQQCWSLIKKEANFDVKNQQFYFPTTSGDILVDLPWDYYTRREIKPVQSLKSDQEKFNVQLRHKPDTTIEDIIMLIEQFLDIRIHNTISSNEISSISQGRNCSYLSFLNVNMRNDFLAFTDRHLNFRAFTIDTQAIITHSTTLDEKEEPKKSPESKLEKFYNKKIIKEACTDKSKVTHNESKNSIIYKPNRPEAGSAKFSGGKDEHRVKQGEMKIIREKYKVERKSETSGSKKIPRKYKFTIKSKAMKKLFTLMGTGQYEINLNQQEDEGVETAMSDEEE